MERGQVQTKRSVRYAAHFHEERGGQWAIGGICRAQVGQRKEMAHFCYMTAELEERGTTKQTEKCG